MLGCKKISRGLQNFAKILGADGCTVQTNLTKVSLL